MNKKIRYFIILFTMFCITFSIYLIPSKTYASSSNLTLINLDFDVDLNSNGDATITEAWNINIRYTNTLFKTFKLDDSKYSDIYNVSVVETTNNQRKYFTQDYYEQYHVTKDHYYALNTSSDTFEIAWGVNEDDSAAVRTFEITYTIRDAVKNYSDCSEFYWQLVGSDFEIDANKVTGTIHLPYSVTSIEDFRVWAHGPLNGNISKEDTSTATFEVEDLDSNTMLEIRVATPTSVFPSNYNISQENKLSSILSEEEKWAEEANAQRQRNQLISLILGFLVIVAFFVGFVFVAIYIAKILEYRRTLKEIKKIEPLQKLDYFRDIPDETATPAQTNFIYSYEQGGLQYTYSSTLSATLLDLCLKKYISFQVDNSKKNKVTIIFNSTKNLQPLVASEEIIWKLLNDLAKEKNSNMLAMKDFETYAQTHVAKFQGKLDKMMDLAEKEITDKGLLDEELEKKANVWKNKYSLYLTFGLLLCFLTFGILLHVGITLLVAAYYCYKIYKKLHTLSQKGVDEFEKLKGLKKYMEDFSMIDKREIPELVLWEKYLVYATAFGIADKVLKQLKIVYPQLTDPNYMSSHSSSYTYFNILYATNLTNNSSNFDFISSLNSSASSSCNYSSGSGAGGGFSGGGGGRRRRWPVAVEDKIGI